MGWLKDKAREIAYRAAADQGLSGYGAEDKYGWTFTYLVGTEKSDSFSVSWSHPRYPLFRQYRDQCQLKLILTRNCRVFRRSSEVADFLIPTDEELLVPEETRIFQLFSGRHGQRLNSVQIAELLESININLQGLLGRQKLRRILNRPHFYVPSGSSWVNFSPVGSDIYEVVYHYHENR